MKRLFLIPALPIFVAACSVLGLPDPQTPAQAVYETQGGFLAALTVANQYKSLPPCPTVKICSDPKVVAVVQKVATATDAALQSADATVNDPAFKDGPVAQKAALAAQSALTALTTITATLTLK